MQQTLNQRIEGTDLYIFSKNQKTGDFTYSRPISMEEANEIASKVPGLKVADTGSLTYMNTLRGIKANRELMRQTNGNIWFPTIEEGFALHDANLLPSEGLIDFGIALYDARNPDKQIAEKLTAIAIKNGYALPVLASFKSLDLEQEGERYGVTPIIISQDGLISGKDATTLLERFNRKGDSGVRRLYHDDGDWDADWSGNLDDSGDDCRVGRVSAVGSAKNLIELAENEIRSAYDSKKEAVKKNMRSLEKQLGDLANQLKISQADKQNNIESVKRLLG